MLKERINNAAKQIKHFEHSEQSGLFKLIATLNHRSVFIFRYLWRFIVFCDRFYLHLQPFIFKHVCIIVSF